jgi:hypothetical protein
VETGAGNGEGEAVMSEFRSGLEVTMAAQLKAAGVDYEYEQFKVRFVTPAKNHTYTPDFKLPNGIIIETKGRFLTADRAKHLLVRAQNPELDIRFVFSSSKAKISKNSPTTYADWCDKHGFKYADKVAPASWLLESSTCH